MEADDKLNENNKNNDKASVVFIFQVIAWIVAIGPIFGDYTGSDPAGNGMSEGLSILFITLPALIFVFFSSVYVMSLKSLNKLYKVFSLGNIIVLLSAFMFGILF